MRSLVVFFSQTGHTRKAAHDIAKYLGSEILEIKPKIPYTESDLDGYNESSRTFKEQHDPDSRPEIQNIHLDIKNYDRIFIGFPIWWYIAPRLIYTFIETLDLRGKEIFLFATSYESTIEKAYTELKEKYSNLDFKERKLLNNDATIKDWIKKV